MSCAGGIYIYFSKIPYTPHHHPKMPPSPGDPLSSPACKGNLEAY